MEQQLLLLLWPSVHAGEITQESRRRRTARKALSDSISVFLPGVSKRREICKGRGLEMSAFERRKERQLPTTTATPLLPQLTVVVLATAASSRRHEPSGVANGDNGKRLGRLRFQNKSNRLGRSLREERGRQHGKVFQSDAVSHEHRRHSLLLHSAHSNGSNSFIYKTRLLRYKIEDDNNNVNNSVSAEARSGGSGTAEGRCLIRKDIVCTGTFKTEFEASCMIVQANPQLTREEFQLCYKRGKIANKYARPRSG